MSSLKIYTTSFSVLLILFCCLTFKTEAQKIKMNDVFIKDYQIKLSSDIKESLLSDISLIKKDANALFIIDRTDKIFIFDTKGKFIKILGKNGQGPGEYQNPSDIGYDKNNIYVHDRSQNKIIIYDKTYKYKNEFKLKSKCSGMLLSKDYIFFSYNNYKGISFFKYAKNGDLIKEFDIEEKEPFDLVDLYSFTDDNNGNIYHCELGSFIIRKFDQDYNLLNSIRISQRPKIVYSKEKREVTNIQKFFRIDDYLVAKYVHINLDTKLFEFALLFFDKNLNFIDDINIDKDNESDKEFINVHPLDNQLVGVKMIYTKNKELENPTLTFYKFKGIK